MPLQSALVWDGLISSLVKLGLSVSIESFAKVLSSEGMGGVA